MGDVVRLVTSSGKDLGIFPTAAVTELGGNVQVIADALAADPDGEMLRDRVNARFETSLLQMEFAALQDNEDESPDALRLNALLASISEAPEAYD